MPCECKNCWCYPDDDLAINSTNCCVYCAKRIEYLICGNEEPEIVRNFRLHMDDSLYYLKNVYVGGEEIDMMSAVERREKHYVIIGYPDIKIDVPFIQISFEICIDLVIVSMDFYHCVSSQHIGEITSYTDYRSVRNAYIMTIRRIKQIIDKEQEGSQILKTQFPDCLTPYLVCDIINIVKSYVFGVI